jgi:hypothetical protein
MLAGWIAAAHAAVEPGDAVETRPAPINACELLSVAAVTEATGTAAQPGIRRDAGHTSDGAYSSTCIWILDGENVATDQPAFLRGRSYVILNAMRWPEGRGLADTFLQAFHDAAEIGEIPGAPASRDYGDAALWWGDGLAVRAGDVSFGLSVVLLHAEPGYPGEFEERLAPAVLRHLEQGAE